MGFNKRRMEDERRQAAEKEGAARRATEKQFLEDADHLITVWNERQVKRMPMLFSPTIGAAITVGYWFLRARCRARRTAGDVDLRMLDWHRGAAVTALMPALSCRSCRPNAPFAELVCLSKSSVAEEYYAERSRNRWSGSERRPSLRRSIWEDPPQGTTGSQIALRIGTVRRARCSLRPPGRLR
jgi:hypothetical protein